MLLTTERDTLLEPILKTTGFVAVKQTMPILSNIYLRKSGEQLTVIANDLEIQASITTNNKVDGSDFTITVPGKKFQDILKTLPESAQVKLEQQENKLLVKSGRAKFALHTLSAEHYPLIKIQGRKISSINLEQSILKRMLNKIQYAMADKDTRVFLNGLFLEIKNKQLNLVATDAHRLGFASYTLTEDIADCNIIIPRKTIVELSRFLTDSSDPITITTYPTQIVFETANQQLISKVIDGKYPDYERVIPLNNPKICLINRELLLKTIDRVSVIGFDKLKTVTFDLSKNHLAISCRNEDQEESNDEIEVCYDHDEPLKLNFNLGYVRDLLTNTPSDELQWELFDSQRSVLIKIPNEDDFKGVIMPLRH